jgi:hypothetical protein
MAGKQEKVLFNHNVQDLLAYAQHSRYPVRNRVIVLLSVKAGLRADGTITRFWLRSYVMGLDIAVELATIEKRTAT